jgi:hypothetical protein
VIEALTGLVFLAILVARLVAAFRAPGEQARSMTRRRWPPSNVRPDASTSIRRKPPGAAGKAPSRDP